MEKQPYDIISGFCHRTARLGEEEEGNLRSNGLMSFSALTSSPALCTDGRIGETMKRVCILVTLTGWWN